MHIPVLLGAAALGGLTGLIGAKVLSKPKQSTLPSPLPTATRDDAAAQQQDQDALLRRRGGAADIVAGAMGSMGAAGPGATGKATLGS